MEKGNTDICNVKTFLNNTDGNWRNAIYVTCSVCKYLKADYCEDLIVSFDSMGTPSIMFVSDANYVFGRIIDKSECIFEISNARFCELYRLWIGKTFEGNCPLRIKAERKEKQENW